MVVYQNATQAFEHVYRNICSSGFNHRNTLMLPNIGFTLLDPMSNNINTLWRRWSSRYAEREWEWYLSGNPNAEEISKFAPIWKNHMDEIGDVRSNYGWQWSRNNQLYLIIEMLKKDPTSRQAVISIYDGKEIDTYSKDTPCTLSIHFQIYGDRLHMSVNMRSNDIVLGFCNDQYCFSNLQKLVSDSLDIPVGTYYHFASNMHIYHSDLEKYENI